MASVRTAVSGIDQILAGLDGLLEMRIPVARAMGVAMGQSVRDEAIVRAPVLKPGNEGYDNQRAGQLKDAMYLAFDGRRSILSGGIHMVYTVSWNARKAPHGHLLEFGHWSPYEAHTLDGKWFTPVTGKHRVGGRARNTGIPRKGGGIEVSAEPFLGPAFDMKLPRLMAIAGEAGAQAFAESMK